MRFIALLRALGLAVASYGISHAQIERRLCARITDGQKAMVALRDNPTGKDQEELQRLVARKIATQESGLARTDGRRDRAGGQRIGELLAGKFPRGAMPSRRRTEVCVDVLLEILAEKDPAGYAQHRYGTREHWHELWLEADQRRLPEIDPAATMVLGYLDLALSQLGAATVRDPAAGVAVPLAPRAEPDTEPVVDSPEPGDDPGGDPGAQVGPAAHPGPAARPDRQAATEPGDVPYRAETLPYATPAARDDDRLSAELARHRSLARRYRRACLVLAALQATTISTGLALFASGALRAEATHTVQLAAAPQRLAARTHATFDFRPALPAGKNWTVSVRLQVRPTDQAAACTYDVRIAAHLEADGRALPAFTSRPGETTITPRPVGLGRRGSDSLRLIVTDIATDPECQLQLDPSGSLATATG